MKIQNHAELAAESAERKPVLDILEAGLAAVDTETVIKKSVRVEGDTLFLGSRIVPFSEVDHLYVIAIGKCAFDASRALEEVLGDRLAGGISLDIQTGPLSKIKSIQGDHPFTTDRNVFATAEIISFLKPLNERDFVIFVISGGGSALLCQPHLATAGDEASLIKALFKAGATIQELNTVRKHFSNARGGFLAQWAYPAKSFSLIFSDVPGDDVQFISSGPTILDRTTVEDAKAILAKYGLGGTYDHALLETPKDAEIFERADHMMAVSNRIALEAMAEKAKEYGLKTEIRTTTLQGEAREIGVKILKELHEAAPDTALFYGGETTVTIQGSGKGGRNQEMSLAGLAEVAPDEILVSLASDGHDNTDAAGGMCDIVTKNKAVERQLVPETFLNDNNSYEFFTALNETILTGDTGSNVADLIVVIKKSQ